MIEFKQIIGRGTRLFEGKHYFTIIDFVNLITYSVTLNGMASLLSQLAVVVVLVVPGVIPLLSRRRKR